MKNVLQSKNFWVVLLLWGGFWPVAAYIPRPFLFDTVNSLSIAACLGVAIAFVPSVYRFFFRNDLDGAHYWVMGIVGALSATAARHMLNWVWRWLDKPGALQDHIIVAWLVWVIFTAACVILLSRDMLKGEIPKENWRWLGIVIGVGVAATLLAVLFLDPQGPLAVGLWG